MSESIGAPFCATCGRVHLGDCMRHDFSKHAPAVFGPNGTRIALPTPPLEPTMAGMTLRDYFAGQALAGILAGVSRDPGSIIADTAYRLADAMLESRSTRSPEDKTE